jgi:hypothetical protein
MRRSLAHWYFFFELLPARFDIVSRGCRYSNETCHSCLFVARIDFSFVFCVLANGCIIPLHCLLQSLACVWNHMLGPVAESCNSWPCERCFRVVGRGSQHRMERSGGSYLKLLSMCSSSVLNYVLCPYALPFFVCSGFVLLVLFQSIYLMCMFF